MIKTQKQAVSAVKEIQRRTGYTLGMVARCAYLQRSTITRLMRLEHEPSYKTRTYLFMLLMDVRVMK